MNAEKFRAVAERALNALPERFCLALENVVIVTEDFPDAGIQRQMQLATPYDLLGLYEGNPVTERSVMASGSLPDMIYLYRQPILAACAESGEEIDHCIRHVLIHEIGHHFGYSDEQMELIESQASGLAV